MRLASRLGERCMEGEGFGDCLKRFMATNPSEHVCMPKCLAVQLSYEDASSVNRWLRGDSAPKLASDMVDTIITHLGLTESQAKELRDAQERSLRKGNKPRRTPKVSAHTSIVPLVQRGRHPDGQPLATAPRGPSTDNQQSDSILNDMIALLEGLPHAMGLKDEEKTITLTWQGRDAVEMSDALQARWRAALQSVLRRGWRINYLCRLDKNIHRTVRLVEMMFDYVGTGNYFPRYFTTYGTLPTPYDMLIVPGVAAALLFSGRTANSVDDGMMIWNAQHVAMLAAHAQRLATQTTPLVRAYFSAENNIAYWEALRESESYSGGRYVVIDGLSAATQPARWFTEFAEPPIPIPESLEWEQTARNRGARVAYLWQYINHYHYYDICTEAAIERLMRGYSFSRQGPWSETKEARKLSLEHMRNLVDLLHNERFHLALVTNGQRSNTSANGINMESTWEVGADNSVLLETWVPDNAGHSAKVSLHITESTVAEGFREYFRQMWDRIPPDDRDNENIIARLQRYIAELERDIEGSPE